MINVDKIMCPEKAEMPSIHVEKPIGRYGLWRVAQKCRRRDHYEIYSRDMKKTDAYEWAQSVIKTEMQLCATVQRELFLKEETQKVRMSPIEHDEKQLLKWAEELVLLDQEYWRLERTHYIAECHGRREPSKYAYSSLRENPVNGYVRIVQDEAVVVADNANAAKDHQTLIV
ncbi:hypothetical protein N7530_009936 [Penicillium desertorum]|uniref:Uncharacterized protein n=1 Tax=Penicillium desertorum TaxID=1303715 RepID=A0A9X0BIK5_9EURO|nr:hypothetical protein N7530_009936 [Penicillium desertorum]